MFNRFNSSKCKTQCKLCTGRIKLMRNKRNINLAQLRREVAELLKNNKQEHARIRVEAVLREANLLKAYDVLELFTEMLAVRVQMIEKSKDTPPDMLEALSSIVYASQRVQDFPELSAIRALLAQKYGKEFVAEAADDSICRKWQVNENLRNCLAVDAPSPELKLQTLSDIAQEHNVEWDAHSAAMDMLPYNHPTTAPGYFNGGQQAGNSRQAMPWDQQQQQQQQQVPGPQGWNAQQSAGSSPDPYSQAANAPPPTSLPGARAGNSNNNNNNNNRGDGPGNAPVSLGLQGGRASSQHPPGQLGGSQAPPGANDMSLEEYADAMAAAAAAKMYSGRAQEAAEAAARHAASPQRSSRADSGSFSLPPGNPPPKAASQAPTQPPTFPPAPDSQGNAPPPNAAPGGNGPPPSNHYRTPTDEEIQRRYDAAPGPPAKGGGAPSAPSAPPRPPSPGGLPPRAPSPGRGPTLSRTSPSSTSGSAPPSTTPAAKPKPTEDLDELTRRFEALKRG